MTKADIDTPGQHQAKSVRRFTKANSHKQDRDQSESKRRLLITLFLFFLAIPIIFYIGTLRLTPYRLLLLVSFIPCILIWLRSKVAILPADILLVLYCVWAALALLVNHGPSIIEFIGMLFIETLSPYFLARILIKNKRDFLYFSKCLFYLVVLLMPFAVIETLTEKPIILDTLGAVFPTYPNMPKDPRWGLDRVQGPFQHPILFGVFCSAGFALAFYVLGYGKNILSKFVYASAFAFGTFISLSSGPLSALVLQNLIILWDATLRNYKNKWRTLIYIILGIYVFLTLASNRGPFKLFIAYFSFSEETAYNRINIWDYGSAEVLRHPVFGIGNNQWQRLSWMSDSMDMFWLVQAVLCGLPGALFFAGAFLWMIVKLARAKITDSESRSFRTGLVITLVGLCIAGWTVHYWNEVYCLFMFILGSGSWIISEATSEAQRAVSDMEGSVVPNRRGAFGSSRRLTVGPKSVCRARSG